MPGMVFEAVMEHLVIRKAEEDRERERLAEEHAAEELRRQSQDTFDESDDDDTANRNSMGDHSDSDESTHDTAVEQGEAAFFAANLTEQSQLATTSPPGSPDRP